MRIGGWPRRSNAKPAKPAKKKLLGVLCALCVLSSLHAGCSGGTGLFKQYEYEEDMYLSLDGTATLYVNSSIVALNALRGTSFDTNPSTRVDRDAIRRYFSTPYTQVTRVTDSRRNGRRFAHVRMDVSDVRKLGQTAPFGWSVYHFDREGDHFVYRQTIGPSASGHDAGSAWNGGELVAFRMHLPSKIDYHNTPTHRVGRGNILTWEQPLADRLRSVPLTLDARMQTESILYRTLWLFGITFIAVALLFVAIIWWVLRKGKPAPHAFSQS